MTVAYKGYTECARIHVLVGAESTGSLPCLSHFHISYWDGVASRHTDDCNRICNLKTTVGRARQSGSKASTNRSISSAMPSANSALRIRRRLVVKWSVEGSATVAATSAA